MRGQTYQILNSRAAFLLLFAGAMLAAGSTAKAAATRFVRSNGSDGAACTLSAPCRTLQRGVDQTPDGGELIVLDSGAFGGSLEIGKSISIIADGVIATLTNPGTVTIKKASAVVALRGLHLKGVGNNADGVRIVTASIVHIENCVIERFVRNGIRLAAETELLIDDSVARDNGAEGLFLNAGGTAAKLYIDHSRFEKNGSHGISVAGIESDIKDSVFSGNGGNGVAHSGGQMNIVRSNASHNLADGFATSGGGGLLNLESSVARGNNGAGLHVTLNGTARISNVVMSDNGLGVVNAGTVKTRLNNTVEDNFAGDVSGIALETFNAK